MSIKIRFQFDPEKAIQVMAYLVKRLGEVEKVKLTKLLYIADRDHFLKMGWPITGDAQFAMDWGPVPSGCLRVLDGESLPDPDIASRTFAINDNRIRVSHDPGETLLAESEKNALDEVLREHGRKYRWALCDETHRFPEYVARYVAKTSTEIPYELILKVYGSDDDAKFRFGRPVISSAMAEHMVCPFPQSDADL